MKDKARIGIITSSGGSTIGAVFQILKDAELEFDFAVLSDRECKSEVIAKTYGYETKRIPYSKSFDDSAKQYLFDEMNVQLVIMLYSRLISEVLFSTGKCVNIHPSLLPAFPGLNATTEAFLKQVRYLGVTTHFVDKGIDTGRILSQCLLPIYQEETLKQVKRKSHYLRVYSFLQILEIFFPVTSELSKNSSFCSSPLANPGLKNEVTRQLFRSYAEDIPELGNFL